jgi:ABC-type Fe3+/spermidine/putrescine transport system ATPase subunit
MLIESKQISKSYQGRTVLHPIDLNIYPAERLAIIGETGSGKTTLLRALAGLIDLDAGEIHFNGVRVKGASEVLIAGHPSISYLHQSVNLRNHYKVVDLLERYSLLEREEDIELARLCQVDSLLDRMTDQLSGGERQRIALAIELAKRPSLLLLDEPFSNLDISHRNTLQRVLADLHEKKGMTIVIVSHNPTEVLGWADRMLVMRNGTLLQTGTPSEIYERPVDEYVAQLLGPYNLVFDEAASVTRILRPEHLYIDAASTAGWVGVIRKRTYEGHSTLYTIKDSANCYLIKDERPDLPIGKEVGIFIKEKFRP